MGSFASEQGSPAIQAWKDSLLEPEVCWWCGALVNSWPYSPGTSSEVHHIARKSHVRAGIRDHACNLFITHPYCHMKYLSSADQAIVLSRKLLHDPEHFDLAEWVNLCGKGPNFVTMRDIVKHLEVRR